MKLMHKGIRVLSAILVLGILIGFLPAMTLPVSAKATGLTLEELKEKFPDGMFWNGSNPDGWTDTGCSHHKYGCTYDGRCGCNTFLGQSSQCMGFAEKLAYDASGYNPRKNENGWYTYTAISALNNVKPGDIIRSRGHSVYVIDVQGTTVTFADCNYDGNCNIRWGITKDISYFKSYFSHVRSAPTALASGYLAQCQRLSSEGTVKIVAETILWTSPCTQDVYERSEKVGVLQAQEQVSVLALYQNSLGEYWYKISYNGAACYLPAVDTDEFHPYTDTIAALDVAKPVNVKYLNGFSIGGVIRADGMMLTQVGAYIYPGMDVTGEPCLVSEESGIEQISYQIAGSAVDKNLKFGQLAKGTYTYVIRATAANRYANRGELSTWSITQTLHRNIFVVSGTSTGDYTKSCTQYNSTGTVVLKEDTVLRNVPCKPETNPAAVEIATMEAGLRVEVTGLYRNTLSDWWYETTYDGLKCYIFAGNTVSFKLYSDGVFLTDANMPTHNKKGNSFAIQGIISSYALPLSVVGAYVYAGTDINAQAVIASEDTKIVDKDGNPSRGYDLQKSTVDYFLTFGKLPVGEYTYVLKAYTLYYYADENQQTKILQEHILHRNTFTVSDKVTCVHNYTQQITQPATCISDGVTTNICTKCGFSYDLHTFANGIHKMGPWETVKEASCTEEGYAISLCAGCGFAESKLLPVSSHTYQAVVTPPQNGAPGYTTYTCTACGDSYEEDCIYLDSTVSQWNVTLVDDLQVNFHMQYDEMTSENAQIQITLGDQIQMLPKSEVASIHIAAAQMNDTISVQVVDGEAIGQLWTGSVAQYAREILQDEEQSDYHLLVKQMLSYGAAAQIYFAYNQENLADGDLEPAAQEEIPAQAESDMIVEDDLSGIAFAGATLVFRNRIAQRFYFLVNDDIADYTFTVDGQACEPVEKDGMYYIEIGDILPQNLHQSITVTVNEGLSVTYSPMNYMVNMSHKGSENMKTLVKALYNYHLAAKQLAQ